MKTVGTLTFEEGVLKASSPNLPTLTWGRPAELAEARLQCDPPVDELKLESAADMLAAAYGTVPFVREPLPAPEWGEGITAAAREAFTLYLGKNTHGPSDAFRVLRGEVDDFLVCARRYGDVWKAGAFTVGATTLTFRFEDLWAQLPKTAVKYTDYLVEVVRDANGADSEERRAAGVVRETLTGVAPDARICVELAAGGGCTLTFWPVALRALL